MENAAYETIFTVDPEISERFGGFTEYSLTAESCNIQGGANGFVPHGLGYVSGVTLEGGVVVDRFPVQVVGFDHGKDLLELKIVDSGYEGEEFSLWSHAVCKEESSVRLTDGSSFKSDPAAAALMRAAIYALFKKNRELYDFATRNAGDRSWIRDRIPAIATHIMEFGFSKFNDDSSPVASALVSDLMQTLTNEYLELANVDAILREP